MVHNKRHGGYKQPDDSKIIKALIIHTNCSLKTILHAWNSWLLINTTLIALLTQMQNLIYRYFSLLPNYKASYSLYISDLLEVILSEVIVKTSLCWVAESVLIQTGGIIQRASMKCWPYDTAAAAVTFLLVTQSGLKRSLEKKKKRQFQIITAWFVWMSRPCRCQLCAESTRTHMV